MQSLQTAIEMYKQQTASIKSSYKNSDNAQLWKTLYENNVKAVDEISKIASQYQLDIISPLVVPCQSTQIHNDIFQIIVREIKKTRITLTSDLTYSCDIHEYITAHNMTHASYIIAYHWIEELIADHCATDGKFTFNIWCVDDCDDKNHEYECRYTFFTRTYRSNDLVFMYSFEVTPVKLNLDIFVADNHY
jgi:hypothetical protein